LIPVRIAFDAVDEQAFVSLARATATAWQSATSGALLVGLSGELGAGKTTWVRAMLAGLGYSGRVPSPTYTLLEHYDTGVLNVVHVDLYRLGGRGHTAADADAEIESLGLRDWLATDRCWVLVEWPERAPALARGVDVQIQIVAVGETGRRLVIELRSAAALPLEEPLRRFSESASS
jgi:tRNA threonylcarbamoyladenosine biosynthesis protein TsaE